MTIQVGDTLPNAKLPAVVDGKISEVSTAELFAGKKAVLFAMPGAFTATCSREHLPGVVDLADELQAAGAELLVCLSVNDASTMKAWGEAQNVGGRITLLADGSAVFTKAVGLELDLSAINMGVRSQRYAAIVEDGKVTALHVEKPRELEVSTAEAMLAALKG